MNKFSRKRDKERRQKQELQKERKKGAALKCVLRQMTTDRNGDKKR